MQNWNRQWQLISKCAKFSAEDFCFWTWFRQINTELTSTSFFFLLTTRWNKTPTFILKKKPTTMFFLISFKIYNAESISEIQSHSNIPVMKTITIWSLLKSLQHPVKNIDHDSDSRLRDIIILITSLEPLGETKEFKGHTNWVCCWTYSGKDKNIYILLK